MITPFRPPRLRSVNRTVLLGLTGAGLFLASLDAYVVVTALLPMLKSVNIAVNRPEQATPIITGFLLGYLAVMPVAGGLSDRFGRLRLFAVCLVLFAFGSFLTATAPSLAQLVTGRVLQGAGGGALVPAGLALAADLDAAAPEQSPVGEGFIWQLPAAIVCFGLFVWHERRTPHPLINVRRFRDSSFTGSALTNAIAGAGLMVALVYIPVLANAVFSMNASSAALLLFRLMLGIPVGALLGGFLAQRLRSYRVVAAVAEALKEDGTATRRVRALGIGLPGPVDPAAGLVISPANLPGFRNVPLNRILTRATGIPSYLHHDAHLAALGEHRRGAARGASDMIYVTVSTGIGAGLLLRGELYAGAHGIAGEVGHIVVQRDGPLCTCGNRGCLEAIASGTGIARAASELAPGTPGSALHGLDHPHAEDVARGARSGDELANAILENAGTYLGLAMGTLVNLFNPQLIVLGGR